jgi:hypothetical protein
MNAPVTPAFDVESVGRDMIDAARATLGRRASQLRDVGEMEIRRLAAVLAEVGAKAARGDISPSSAKKIVRLHRLTLESVLQSVEGLSLLAASDTVKSAARVALGALSHILKFKLI